MHWYLIHTKPRQELRALENLERQGYECYLPLLPTEKIQEKLFATFQLSLEKKIQKESGHEWFEDYNDFEQ